MKVEDISNQIEEGMLDILARIDDGDDSALGDLKKLKRYFAELNDMLSVVDENDDIESIKQKFDELSKKFDEFLMAVVKVVG